ncbi:unnamed protein product [Periconia digitata]|uniref:Uncharacterized protein n=1 Tax=Periconia digitata TaxID=1303443 RepID=A0A9W4UMZ4_9PLEO|nr:unnamed protein product [Periconia digitata]
MQVLQHDDDAFYATRLSKLKPHPCALSPAARPGGLSHPSIHPSIRNILIPQSDRSSFAISHPSVLFPSLCLVFFFRHLSFFWGGRVLRTPACMTLLRYESVDM